MSTRKNKSKKHKSDNRSKKPAATQSVKPAIDFAPGFWKNNWLPALLILITALAIYFQSTQFGYVLDDQIVLSENSYVQKGFGGIKDILFTESFSGYFGGEQRDLVEGARYRPLSIITFAIEHQLFGQKPGLSHFINILLYGLTGLLIFRILAALFPIKQADWWLALPFVASMIYIVHPVHSEVIANIKGRDEILCFLGAMATLYSILKYFSSKNMVWLAFGAGLFFLALLAKENAITFLAIIPLTLFCFSKAPIKSLIVPTAVLVGVTVAYLLLRMNVIGYLLNSGKEIVDIMNNPFANMSVAEKSATIMYTLGEYIRLSIFPHPLTHDYYPYHVPIMNWGDWQVLLSFAVNAGVLIYALMNIFKKKLVAYSILFYFISLSIVSNIPFSVGTFMNERFIYISTFGYALIVAWLISIVIPRWLKDSETNLLSIGLFALLVIAFGAKTITRVPSWENAMTLNQAAIKVSKNSARANLFMGTAIYKQVLELKDPAEKQPLIQQAEQYFNNAIRIHPRYSSAYKMQAGVAAEIYKIDRDIDKLLAKFRRLILIQPNLNFIEQYMDYLIKQGYAPQVADWCYDIGTQLLSQSPARQAFGVKYLENYGLAANPSDSRIKQTLANYYRNKGNTAKANQYSN